MVSLHEKQEEPNGRQKEQRGTEAQHLSEPQKAHLKGTVVYCGIKWWLFAASFGH